MAAPMKRPCEESGTGISPSGEECLLKKQSTDCQMFLSWCEQEGIIQNSKVTVRRSGSCAQCGMIALDDISKGETLFTVPRSVLLHPATCSPVVAQRLEEDEDSLETESGWVPLILAVMYEHTNRSSRWRPYLDLFPDYSELDQPMFWDSNYMQPELRGTGIAEAVQRDLRNIDRDYHDVALPFIKKNADLFSEEKHNLDLYKRTVSFIMAYSFTESPDYDEDDDDSDDDDEETHPPMMVPLADALNHIAKNNAQLKFGKESLRMVATEDIKKGSEVFNTYGEIANWQLLHMYGFAEEYPENIYDTVDIPHRYLLEEARTHEAFSATMDERWKFLKELEAVSDDGGFVIGMDGVLAEDEVFMALKVITLDKETYDNLGPDDCPSPEEESFTNGELCNLPESWRGLLAGAANRTLKNFNDLHPKDTDAESSVPEELAKLSHRARYSLYVRMGQRKILERLVDFCRITW
ncbi:N-lysine methyltransferase setd6 [Strongylocentrotus purpuratus]|uniref:N-lysine methyltransferase n=1 Tax=Strongylocentrotus purpuratus TaxID=7668 RepID=A0A7M7RER8_STRPU|nr:N-lysine methyltransferase setd6 [Strongylocentrotus purpuratus]